MTRGRKPILQFLLLFALVYAVLIAPWPGLQRGYGIGFRSVMHRVVAVLDLADRVYLPALDRTESETDREERIDIWLPLVDQIELRPLEGANLWVLHRDPGTGMVKLKLHRGGDLAYMATAFLIALTLATPIRWRSRFVALLVALVCFDAYLVARLMAHFAMVYSFDPLPGLSSPELAYRLLGSVAYVPWYVMPIFTWVLTVAHPVYREHLCHAETVALPRVVCSRSCFARTRSAGESALLRFSSTGSTRSKPPAALRVSQRCAHTRSFSMPRPWR